MPPKARRGRPKGSGKQEVLVYLQAYRWLTTGVGQPPDGLDIHLRAEAPPDPTRLAIWADSLAFDVAASCLPNTSDRSRLREACSRARRRAGLPGPPAGNRGHSLNDAHIEPPPLPVVAHKRSALAQCDAGWALRVASRLGPATGDLPDGAEYAQWYIASSGSPSGWSDPTFEAVARRMHAI